MAQSPFKLVLTPEARFRSQSNLFRRLPIHTRPIMKRTDALASSYRRTATAKRAQRRELVNLALVAFALSLVAVAGLMIAEAWSQPAGLYLTPGAVCAEACR